LLRNRAVPVVLAMCAAGLSSPATAKPATTGELATLTSLVTAALAADDRLDVLSSADVRQVMAFEGEKQAVGCADDTSCLAEVAGAMGAGLVVFGQLGALGTQRVLTLNLFDAHEGRSEERVVIKAESVQGLGEQLDGNRSAPSKV